MTGVLVLSGEPARSGWQCPGCLTYYAPDVRECCCATVRPSLAGRVGAPEPIRLGSGCTCGPYGPGTVPCPVHHGGLSVSPPAPFEVRC